jgi:NarL family two-component system response regulator LiaR
VALPAEVAARLLGIVGRRDALTAREAEVLRLVAHGLANKQVAYELGISVSTVKAHVGSLLAKLSLTSRTRLALFAAQTGLAALERHDLGMASGHAMSAS